jgi:hypothetical protein
MSFITAFQTAFLAKFKIDKRAAYQTLLITSPKGKKVKQSRYRPGVAQRVPGI